MDDVTRPLASDLSPAQSRQWIGRLLIGVVLGVAIWNFVVALTAGLLLPALARVMEADPQSPLYLGKGDFNVPAIFAAVLELCLALIAALIVNSWAQRRPRTVRRKLPAAATASTSILAPPVAPTPAAVQTAGPVAPTSAASAPAEPMPAAVAKLAEPEKPKSKKPKAVYYNSVGEPVEDDE